MRQLTNSTRFEKSMRILKFSSILRSESLLSPNPIVGASFASHVALLNCDLSVNLINKDQVDILASLRESVNEDKALLEAETDHLKQQIKELNEKNRMQLEQVNALLLEKVNLQSEGIGQRERMLQRERDIGFVLSFVCYACHRECNPGTCAPPYQERMCLKMSRRGYLPFMKRT